MLEQYSYDLDPNRIAQTPAKPRDAARLLVYRRKEKERRTDIFRNLGTYLPPRAVLVFNQTKVVPARLMLKKRTGGKVELLVIGRQGSRIQVLSNRKLAVGSGMSRGSKIQFTVAASDGRFYYLRPHFPVTRLAAILERHGSAPIPPYIKRPASSGRALRREYQTVFARTAGSIAAPTASLHFTKRLMSALKQQKFSIKFITLHVGLGTFAPLTKDNLRSATLHQERYVIAGSTARELNRVKRRGRPIIAVGTTVVRALESASDARGMLRRLSGSTDLFIRPGYSFKFIDGLITNFHVPRSSLLMLVSAFAGRGTILRLYKLAAREGFRFYSFGDGMLIL